MESKKLFLFLFVSFSSSHPYMRRNTRNICFPSLWVFASPFWLMHPTSDWYSPFSRIRTPTCAAFGTNAYIAFWCQTVSDVLYRCLQALTHGKKLLLSGRHWHHGSPPIRHMVPMYICLRAHWLIATDHPIRACRRSVFQCFLCRSNTKSFVGSRAHNTWRYLAVVCTLTGTWVGTTVLFRKPACSLGLALISRRQVAKGPRDGSRQKRKRF